MIHDEIWRAAGLPTDREIMAAVAAAIETCRSEAEVKTAVAAAVAQVRGDGAYLCIGCLERRLGRILTCADFTDAPVNWMPKWRRSARLNARLQQGE
jgi:hypothetical protein